MGNYVSQTEGKTADFPYGRNMGIKFQFPTLASCSGEPATISLSKSGDDFSLKMLSCTQEKKMTLFLDGLRDLLGGKTAHGS